MPSASPDGDGPAAGKESKNWLSGSFVTSLGEKARREFNQD
jgi:hypothetical protein